MHSLPRCRVRKRSSDAPGEYPPRDAGGLAPHRARRARIPDRVVPAQLPVPAPTASACAGRRAANPRRRPFVDLDLFPHSASCGRSGGGDGPLPVVVHVDQLRSARAWQGMSCAAATACAWRGFRPERHAEPAALRRRQRVLLRLARQRAATRATLDLVVGCNSFSAPLTAAAAGISTSRITSLRVIRTPQSR